MYSYARSHLARDWVMLMPIDATNHDRAAVVPELAVDDCRVPERHLARLYALASFIAALCVHQLHHETVHSWRFRTPQLNGLRKVCSGPSHDGPAALTALLGGSLTGGVVSGPDEAVERGRWQLLLCAHAQGPRPG